MKSYLNLASIQAKVHRRQNRMTIFCIALAVFLVTGVFSMADMEVRNQTARARIDHGNWHIMLYDISEEEAAAALRGAAVEASAWYDVVNYRLDKGCYVLGKAVSVIGTDREFEDIALVHRFADGAFPAGDDEAEITENMRREFGVNTGDRISLETPAGSYDFTVSGFVDDTTKLLKEDACGVLITRSAFAVLCKANGETESPVLYVRFREGSGIKSAIKRLRAKEGWEDKITENTAVLGVMGMSTNGYIIGLYGTAAVLMLLVILAGVLMISGSMNSSIAQRTQYFGMLRCIGAGKKQIRHLIRREALNWCTTGVPLGEAAAIIGVWIICAVLHYGIGGEWALFPVFRLSAAGMLTGGVIGVVTVLLAAGAPARRAAAVSPAEAVCANSCGSVYAGSNTKTGAAGIDRALGINHAFSGRKNIALMTGSFALSILLFLSFSVMIEWIGHALNTTKPYSKDMTVYYDGYENRIPKSLAEQIAGIPGVKYTYGRMYVNTDIASEKSVTCADLISYEALQFNWAEKDFLRGDMKKVTDGSGIMTVFEKDNPLDLGDVVTINGRDVRIEAMLSDSPFSPDGTPVLICSEETFAALTGSADYALIDIQVAKNSGDDTVSEVRKMLSDGMYFSDVRKDKQEVNNTYLAFSVLVYGFLSIVAMITVVNIINSISLSVSARIKQYGIMRAIGMDKKQIRRMISSEALSYALSGCAAGCIAGLPLNAWFFRKVISNYWGTPWKFPAAEIAIIIILVLAAAYLAAVSPAKRITEMTVTDALYYL